MEPVVAIEGATKRFRRLTALRDFSASLMPGEIVGLLGPNGAGKSTLMRLLVGLSSPTSGSIRVLGHEMPKRRVAVMRSVGALIESPAFYEHLSALANLRMIAGYHGSIPSDRPIEILERVGLTGRGDEPVSNYSIGMKRRLGLAAALLPEPQLLVLDEPASGLDPEALVLVEVLLKEQADRGVCVLLSSHLLGEVARVCHRVLVLRQGLLVGSGPAGDSACEWTDLHVSDLERAMSAITGRHPDLACRQLDGSLQIRTLEKALVASAVRAAVEAGIDVHGASAHRPSIEDYYFDVVRQHDEGDAG